MMSFKDLIFKSFLQLRELRPHSFSSQKQWGIVPVNKNQVGNYLMLCYEHPPKKHFMKYQKEQRAQSGMLALDTIYLQ